MSYFKKFCDLIGGIGAFFASVFLLGRYMEYNPGEIGEGESKFKIFFSAENAKEYRQYLAFIVLLFGAVLLGRLLKRFPALTLFMSVLPLCQVMGMLWGDSLYENPEFYVIVCLIVVAGNIYEAFASGKNGGRDALPSASIIVGAFAVITSLLSAKFSSMASFYSEKFLENELSEAQQLTADRLSFFGVDLLSIVPEEEIKALVFIAAALAVCVVFSVLGKANNFRFLNLALAAVPFIYAVSALHTEKYSTSPMLVLVPVTVYFLCRAVLLVRKA